LIANSIGDLDNSSIAALFFTHNCHVQAVFKAVGRKTKSYTSRMMVESFRAGDLRRQNTAQTE
jgi:hypothetical protein